MKSGASGTRLCVSANSSARMLTTRACGLPPAGLRAAVSRPPCPSTVLACLLRGGALWGSFASARHQAGAASHQPVAACGLAAKGGPTAPHPLHSPPGPQSVVVGPLPGVARVPVRRGCAPAAVYLPDPPSFPAAPFFAFAHSQCPYWEMSRRCATRQAPFSFGPLSRGEGLGKVGQPFLLR